jgi:ATP-dependent DNA helicase RecG
MVTGSIDKILLPGLDKHGDHAKMNSMDAYDLNIVLANGENSYIEFKEQVENPVAIAEEIAAFLNFKGGKIYWGISDTGRVVGVADDVHRIEERIMNICRKNILPPIIPAFETFMVDHNTVIAITVPEGLEKPYRTKQGKYLIRVGSTKRQASREELARLFHNSLICHNDDRGISGTTSRNVPLCIFRGRKG